MALTDPVLEALDAAEAGDLDLTGPLALGPHDLAPPPAPDGPPSDPELESAAGEAVMPDESRPDTDEVVEEPEPVVPDDGQEGEGEGESAGPLDEPSSTLSLDAAYETAFGARPDVDRSALLIGLARDLESASPDRVARARQILAGYDDPAPPVVAQPAPAQPAVEAPPFEPIEIPDMVDDETRAVLEAQNAQIARMAEWAATQASTSAEVQRQQYQTQLAAERDAQVEAATRARARFATDTPGLSESDVAVLTDAASRNPLYGVLVAQYHNDYERAAYETFRHTLVDHPQIFERVIAAQTAAEADRAKKDAQRKAKASAVSGAASAPPKSRPATKEERDRAFLDELRGGALG